MKEIHQRLRVKYKIGVGQKQKVLWYSSKKRGSEESNDIWGSINEAKKRHDAWGGEWQSSNLLRNKL